MLLKPMWIQVVLVNMCFVMRWSLVGSTMSDEERIDLATPLRDYGETCGYESCPLLKAGHLNVHLVPHTHAELGYYHNFDQHFTGEDEIFLKSTICMKRALDCILTMLWNKPTRRFTLSDTSFLFHWWARRDITVHRMMYELLRQGRLTLVGGGYVMSDEASVSYQGVIDQFTYSLRKINSTFLECGRPLVAWQADSYGHSREFASLMAQMGFDGLFINPISFDDEVARMRRQGLEFLWRGSDDLGSETDIFTHKLFDGYWAPPGFCFSQTCTDPLLVKSDSLFNNVDERIEEFINSVLYRQSPHYGTRNIMMMMGHRVAYSDADTWFANMETLIDATNIKSAERRLNITVFFSSPPCYLKAVHETNPLLETKQDDFYPFVFNKNSYMVGMYTSRPTLKYIMREGFVYLQIAKQLQVIAELGNNDKFFETFMWITSVIQDHTIATGALRNRVKSYYVAKMDAAITKSTELISRAIRYLRNSSYLIYYNRCLFNISSCNETRAIKHTLQIYNPLGWPVTMPVRLPVILINSKFRVFDNKGKEVKSETMKTPAPIMKIKGRPKADHEVLFIAKNIPPVGFRSYYVQADYYYRPKREIIKKLKMTKPKKYFIRPINPLTIDEKFESLQEYEDYDGTEDRKISKTITIGNVTQEEMRNNIDYDYEIGKETDLNDIFVPKYRKFTSMDEPPIAQEFAIVIPETQIPTRARNPVIITTSTTTEESTTVDNEVVLENVTVIAVDTTEGNPTMIDTTEGNLTTVDTTEANPTIIDTTETNLTTVDTTEENPTTVATETTTVTEKYFELKNTNLRKSDLFIGNKYVRLTLDSKKRVANIDLCNGVHISLNIELYYHISDDPQKLDRPTDRQPGAFLCRPVDANRDMMDQKFDAEIVKNDIVEEVHMTFNDWAFLIIRLYVDSPVIEVNWLVGPIPTDDELGKDVFIRYKTDLKNEGVFYTDSNGRQTIKRIRNMRATYEPVDLDPITGNLYPVTSKIYIEDLKKNLRFSIFNDRCQAGGSLIDGGIDMMVHRRILTDGTGSNSELNETEYDEGIRVIGTHYLYLTKADYKRNKIFEKKFAKEVEMKPRVLASCRIHYMKKGMREEFDRSTNEFSALKKKLPIGVHLLTLEKWTNGILIRLENYLEKTDVLLTGVKVVSLKDMFSNIEILSVREMTLGANMYKSDVSRWQWLKKGKFYKSFNDNYGSMGNSSYDDDDFRVNNDEVDLERGIILVPQQIRTFVAEFRYKRK